MPDPTTGAALILRERLRQIESEGYTPQHDHAHRDGELAMAAICYAMPPDRRPRIGYVPGDWPWLAREWKPTPSNRVRELTKAGALIAAEIDRLLAGQARMAQEATP
jgi:hypothetical protein